MTNEVVNHLTWLVNRVCEKPVWGRAVEQTEPFRTFYKSLKKNLDITKLTLEEARELRFLRWDEHGKLLPLTLTFQFHRFTRFTGRP